MDVIYEERRSDWSHQVSAVATTRWLQCDQALCLSARVWLVRLKKSNTVIKPQLIPFPPTLLVSVSVHMFPLLFDLQLHVSCLVSLQCTQS